MKKKQWVSKEDTGTESNTEAAKGLASDSFKRACFNLGIGRDLYRYPVIQVKLDDSEFNVENNKAKATWNLKIKDWVWALEHDDSGVSLLVASYNGRERYRYAKGVASVTQQDQTQRPTENEKPWFNESDFSPMKPAMINKIKSGERTAEEIVKNLRTSFKVSKKMETEILELAA